MRERGSSHPATTATAIVLAKKRFELLKSHAATGMRKDFAGELVLHACMRPRIAQVAPSIRTRTVRYFKSMTFIVICMASTARHEHPGDVLEENSSAQQCPAYTKAYAIADLAKPRDETEQIPR